MSVVSIATLDGYFAAYARPTAGNFEDLIDTLSLPLVAAADYAADGGIADAYTMLLDPVPTAYVTGKTYAFKAANTNTGASTLNVNGLGAKSIVKAVSTALAAGDIAAGQVVVVRYDGTNMQMVSPAITYGAGNGIEITASNYAVKLDGATLSLSATGLKVAANGIDFAQIATKARGSVFYWGAGGTAAALGPGTAGQVQRTNGAGADPDWWTPPLATSYDSGQQTYTNAGALSLTHGLGGAPGIVTVSAICTNAGGEGGYAQNEEILIDPGFGGNAVGGGGMTIKVTSTQLVVRISDEGIRACNATTGALFAMTAASWALRFRAYR